MVRVVVLGSGIAGLYAALRLAEWADVVLCTKAALADSNSYNAQGGIAAAVGPGDSPASHYADTLAAGAGLVEPAAARVLTEQAPERVADLVRLGVAFDRAGEHPALAREAAHAAARVLHAGGDATGRWIETALIARLREHARVRVREGWAATRLRAIPDRASARVVGVDGLDADGRSAAEEADAVVLATGGAGRLFARTTNPPVATGDGVALAFRAGAGVADPEFYQFHPTALDVPGAPAFLVTEAARGAGAVVRDRDGVAFLREADPRAELAPRDVVARAIFARIERDRAAGLAGPSAFLDMRHLDPDTVRAHFPTVAAVCREHGLDLARDPVPIAPAAHYYMGGVRTDVWGRTDLPGLYACGEVACTGVHGANRLASNSLQECLVYAGRAAEAVLGRADAPPPPDIPEEIVLVPAGPAAGATFGPADVQDLLWRLAGLERDAQGLAEAEARLASWGALGAVDRPAERAAAEAANLRDVGALLVRAALRRTESRGAHYRTDFPRTDPGWRRRQVLVPG
jgi:L-aspartate oxidase